METPSLKNHPVQFKVCILSQVLVCLYLLKTDTCIDVSQYKFYHFHQYKLHVSVVLTICGHQIHDFKTRNKMHICM